MNKILKISLFLLLCLNAKYGIAQQAPANTLKITLKHGAYRIGKRTDEAMETWRAYGLGQFIHWGLYAIAGGEWNGKPYNGAAEWIRSWNGMPKSAYDSLIYQFNPIKFDASNWAKTAKQMGVKYVTITTKHHDGFCLWPSKFSDYNVGNSPYKKDIIGPVVNAYNKEGIDVVLYFSIMDWHNPDWRYDIKTKDDSLAMARFCQYTRHQLLELLERYPTIKGFWFDGTWDKGWVKEAVFADEMEKELRRVHPGLIIGSRLHADEFGKRGADSNGDLIGDYEQGWERKIPEKAEDVHGNDWECVMTVPENQWGYNKAWKGHIKTAGEITEMLARCRSLGGNFVLNFGPRGDGSLRQEELDLARGIGSWMQNNKEAIYNCSAAGFTKQDWGYYTQKTGSNKVYMLVFNVPVSGALRVKIPQKISISKAYMLTEPGQGFVPEEIGSHEYFIHLKNKDHQKPFVIVLETGTGEGKGNTYEKAKT